MVVIVHGLGVCFMPQKLIRMYYRYKTTLCIKPHYIAGFCVNLWLLCLPLFIDYEIYFLKQSKDRLCGLVVRVSGYRYRGPGFDPRRYQIF